MKGFFITFEGLEGSGKSTQVGFLASRLREEGYNIVVIREPGGTRIGETIRDITHNRENVELTAVCEAYLMVAARAQLVREIIRPALSSGKIVLADRFVDSSIAYQGYGRELGKKVIEELNKLALDNIKIDLTFFLDVSHKKGIKRRNNTKKIDRLDLQQTDFYERVYQGYKKIALGNPQRVITIDGTASIEDNSKIIWQTVKNKIKP